MEKNMPSAVEVRKPLITSRQVGMVAAFGGLGFAWRALGLVIPLYPPNVLDIRGPLIGIVSVAGGPVVGILCGLLFTLPSAVPFSDLVYWPILAVFIGSVAKPAYAHRKSWGLPLLLVTIMVAEMVAELAWIFMISEHVMGLVSFMAEFWGYLIGGTYIVDVVAEFLPAAAAMRFFPDFMQPKWTIRRK